jgi:acylphosphatase
MKPEPDRTGPAAVRIIIGGFVQGVGFRRWLARHARRSGVSGWVRNRSDGTVEALLQGSDTAVRALVALARTGPPGARVRQVDIRPATGTDGDPAFPVLPDDDTGVVG